MAKKKYYSETEPCIVTKKIGVDLHHIKSRKAGGTDDTFNLMPLTHELHNECHNTGLTSFSRKYVQVNNWLVFNGWQQCPLTRKWFRPFEEN